MLWSLDRLPDLEILRCLVEFPSRLVVTYVP
jgi:hypothetical protein